VRELCSERRVTLVLDEIQTGLGRTGKLLAEEHEGIEADVTLLGKALSGGFYPISAVLSNSEVLGVLKPGEHGSTFGGNPLACAVARAALRVLIEEGMIENAATQGAYFKSALESIRSNSVREVRGRGLMLAIELHPEAGGARRACEALARRGVLAKDVHEHTIRIAPPLVINRNEVDWAVERFATVLRDL
jgi:ornithine--oxo-acid transaminase